MYAKHDVHIEDERIVGTRFMLQAKNIVKTSEEKDFVISIRGIVEKFPFKVSVFNPFFVFVDQVLWSISEYLYFTFKMYLLNILVFIFQFISVFPTTIQCVAVAAGVMMVISLIFIPNPMCSLWVAFSIISIEAGVIGLMTLWGVRLDSISMINLIMCIGFSGDYHTYMHHS